MPSPLGIRITPNILVICPDFSYSYMEGFLVQRKQKAAGRLARVDSAAISPPCAHSPRTFAGLAAPPITPLNTCKIDVSNALPRAVYGNSQTTAQKGFDKMLTGLAFQTPLQP
jgi:hypothetical protein